MPTPAKKIDLPTEVISNELVAENHYLLRCSCPKIAAGALPGQFIHVLIPQGSGLLLRRPFTIYTAEGDEITMLYQLIGEGTSVLSRLTRGDSIRVLGPLGNTFEISPAPNPAIIVGGGAGIASLMLLAAALRENRCARTRLGWIDEQRTVVERGRFESYRRGDIYCNR